MANNSTTSNDEKSAHQKRTNGDIDAALKSAESDDDDVRWSAPILAAEVRRLREERDLLRTASEAAASKLSAKLARVEALPAKFDEHATVAEKSIKTSWAVPFTTCARELRDALREERDLFADAGRAAELRIVELREQVALMTASLKQQDAELDRIAQASDRRALKLARVEAIISGIDPRLPITANREALESIAATLRDEPQPEREPKLPFNGY